jgi:hypothetical protein
MKLKQFLVPPFLKKLDRYLLTRYPIIWETKIHFVLFYSTFLGNLLLASFVSFYSAENLSLIPYKDLSNYTWTWGTLVGALILLYYAYQQSFVRIPAYTIRQNILRFGLYSLAVVSIISNVLMVPNTIAFRVRQLYDYQSVVNDYQYMQKAVLGIDLYINYNDHFQDRIIETRDYYEEEEIPAEILDHHSKSIEKIKQITWLNQTKQLNTLEFFINELNQIVDANKIENYAHKKTLADSLEREMYNTKIEISSENSTQTLKEKTEFEKNFPKHLDFLKSDYLKIKKSILSQANWPKELKEQLVEKVNYKNILTLDFRSFENCDFTSLNPNILKLKKKYLTYLSERYTYSINGNIVNRNNIGLLNDRFQNLLNYYTNDYLFRDWIKRNVNFIEFYFNNDHKNIEKNQKRNQGLVYFLDNYLTEKQFDKDFNILLIKPYLSLNTSFNLLYIFLLNISLVILSAQLFSLRNIFIAGFTILASHILLLFLNNTEYIYIQKFRLLALGGLSPIFGKEIITIRDTDPILLYWFVPFLIMSISALIATAFILKTIHFKWAQSVWVFILSSAYLSCLSACYYLFSREFKFNIDPTAYEYKFENILSQQIFLIYPLLILSMFLMYAFYNHLTLIPKRK